MSSSRKRVPTERGQEYQASVAVKTQKSDTAKKTKKDVDDLTSMFGKMGSTPAEPSSSNATDIDGGRKRRGHTRKTRKGGRKTRRHRK